MSKQKKPPAPSFVPARRYTIDDPAAVASGIDGHSLWRVRGETPNVIVHNVMEYVRKLTVADLGQPEQMVDGLLREALGVDVWTEQPGLSAEEDLQEIRDILAEHNDDAQDVPDLVERLVNLFDALAEGIHFQPPEPEEATGAEAVERCTLAVEAFNVLCSSLAPSTLDTYDAEIWTSNLKDSIGKGEIKEVKAQLLPLVRAAAVGRALAEARPADLDLDAPLADAEAAVGALLEVVQDAGRDEGRNEAKEAWEQEQATICRASVKALYLRVCGSEPPPDGTTAAWLQAIQDSLGEAPEF